MMITKIDWANVDNKFVFNLYSSLLQRSFPILNKITNTKYYVIFIIIMYGNVVKTCLI